MLNILRIHNIRRYLDKDTTHLLIKSLALSHLDYANSLLTGLPENWKNKSESSTECPRTLHWLPIKSRIYYKVSTLMFKYLHHMAPAYLSKLITIKQQRRQGLRSGIMENILEVPRTKRKMFASWAFSVYGPITWNTVPDSLLGINNYKRCKKDLKTHLFL